MAKQVASLFGVLSLDDGDFIKGLGIAKSGILDLEDDFKSAGGRIRSSLSRVGDKLTEIGGQMTVLGESLQTITGPLMDFGQQAVSAATDFDESMKNIQAAAGYTNEEMVSISDQVFAIGEASRYGPAVAAEAFYEIAGGVTDASSRMAIFESSVAAAQAGNASLASTTSAMIGIMNSYGLSAEEASFASDVLTRAVGTGKGSMEEFGPALAKAAQLAPDLGVSLEDLGSAMAYLTTKNVPAAESATLLKSMMTTLLNPTEDVTDAIRDLGYESGSALIKGEGLVGAYNAMKDVSGFEGVIGNVEALTGATTLATDEFTKFDETFKGSTVSTWNGQTGSAAAMVEFKDNIQGATDAAQGIQMDSAAAQFDLLDSKLEALNVTVGQTLLPTLTDLVNTGIMPVIDNIMGWVSANPQAAATIMLLVGAVAVLGIGLSVVGTAIAAVGTAMTILTGPIGLAIAAAIALGAAYLSNFGGIKTFIDETVAPAINDFIKILSDIWTTVQPGLQDLTDFFITGAIQNMLNIIRILINIARTVGNVLSGIWNKVKPGVEAFAAGIEDALEPVIGFIRDISTAINEVLTLLGSEQIKTAGGTLDTSFAGGTTPKAAGGPVAAGMPYMVGEQGRELFLPSTSGVIIPNNVTEGMMGDTYNVTVIANTAEGGRAAAESFDARFRELRAARG